MARRGPACHQFENNYFIEMCIGSDAGSYLRLIDFVYQSTLGLRVIKKKRSPAYLPEEAHHVPRPAGSGCWIDWAVNVGTTVSSGFRPVPTRSHFSTRSTCFRVRVWAGGERARERARREREARDKRLRALGASEREKEVDLARRVEFGFLWFVVRVRVEGQGFGFRL